MPTHKMVTIGGIRYRPEDAEQLMRARAQDAEQPGDPAGAAVLSMRQADPARTPDPPGPFDPGGHTVAQVLEYLATADETETVRVLAAEAAGQARKSIMKGQT